MQSSSIFSPLWSLCENIIKYFYSFIYTCYTKNCQKPMNNRIDQFSADRKIYIYMRKNVFLIYMNNWIIVYMRKYTHIYMYMHMREREDIMYKLIMCGKMTLNVWFSCPHLLGTGIIDMCHHIWFIQFLGVTPGLHLSKPWVTSPAQKKNILKTYGSVGKSLITCEEQGLDQKCCKRCGSHV